MSYNRLPLLSEMQQESDDTYDRRRFLAQTGKGLVAATILGSIVQSGTATAQSGSGKPGHTSSPATAAEAIKVELPSLDDKTEKKKGLLPAPAPKDDRVGFAIVGLGHLTLEQILPAFGESKYAKPVALVSGHRDKALKVGKQYGIDEKAIYSYDNYDSMRDNQEIEAVYIVLPNGMHEEYTVRAAKAGKHVLCEKPMANTSAEAQRMVDACKAAGRKLMIAYRIQYEPMNRQIKKWLREEQYGKVRVIDMMNAQNIGDPSQFRLKKALAGGGSLPDIGLYCLNTARYITGEEPVQVFGHVYSTPGDVRFKEVEETVLFQLQFPSGTIANCTTSYGVHESRRYRCYGDKGGWFGMDPAFSYGGLKMELSYAQGSMEMKSNPIIESKSQFAPELDHMALCVRGNKQPYTPGEEGVQDMKLMEAIYQPAREGHWVKLEAMNGKDLFRGEAPVEG